MRIAGLVVLCAVLCALLTLPAAASIPAFPGAEGAGAYSIGGRDASLTVYKVTNTNDSGAGSLRAACTASGPRIVVFTVGGTITLQSQVTIDDSYIYIAGQTAPGGGICLKADAGYWSTGRLISIVGAHDVIIRYLRFRPGVAGTENGGVNINDASGPTASYNIIVDHCSLSWATDQNGPDSWASYSATPRTIRDVSFSRNLIAQGLNDHSCGAITGSDEGRVTDVDYHHNFFTSNSNRNPLVGDTDASRVVSNLIYDWHRFGLGWVNTYGSASAVTGDWINNRAKGDTDNTTCPSSGYCTDDDRFGYYFNRDAAFSVYMSGNIGYGQTSPAADQWSLTSYSTKDYPPYGNPAPNGYKRSPWAALSARNVAITADAANTLESILLSDTGANWRLNDRGNPVWARDSADAEFVNEYVSDNGHFLAETDTLPWPTYATGTAYTDSDNDGMADDWETAKFGDTSRNGKGDYDSDGYLDLEEFLNVSDPLVDDSSLPSAYVYATSFSCAAPYCGTSTGTISNVQSSNDSYLVLHDDATTHRLGAHFTIDTPYTPAGVSKMVVQVEFKTSRSDTGTPDLAVWHSDGVNYDDIGPRQLWQTSDGWYTWETTDISTFMDASGIVTVDVGACPTAGNSNRYDVSVDTVRVKVFTTGSAPVAAFSSNPAPPPGGPPVPVAVNQTVNFTSSSTNSPTSWSWAFGDSSTSTSENPSHQYASTGYKTVTLTATNAYGSDDEVKSNYIDVGNPPTANFGGPTTALKGQSVTFTDSSTGSPTSWSWTFGDGNSSTATSPSHTYTAFGKYTVALTATNAYGNDTETKPNYIAVSDYYYATSGSLSCGATQSGSYTNTQASDNSYWRTRMSASPWRTGAQFLIDTPLTPAQVSNMTVEVESHTSRSDADGLLDLTVWYADNSTYYNSRTGWNTSDHTKSFSTAAISTYMNASGVIKLDFGGCNVTSGATWDLYMDAVRVKCDP